MLFFDMSFFDQTISNGTSKNSTVLSVCTRRTPKLSLLTPVIVAVFCVVGTLPSSYPRIISRA